LKGSERLMSRPQEGLKEIFDQLNVKVEFHKDHLIIEGDGWQPHGSTISVNRQKSSQFVSGLLLAAWDLPVPLEIKWQDRGVSEGYWQMSVQVVKDFGMELIEHDDGVTIPAHSPIKITNYTVESDISSTFAIAAYAALNGEAIFHDFPFHTLQPDKAFVDILRKMGVGIEITSNTLRVYRKLGTLANATSAAPAKAELRGVNWNLNECPDLFPVLATLCAFAQGPSRLDGAPHLIFKESNRIQKSAELIHHLGSKTETLPDGMIISPAAVLRAPSLPFSYDTDHDHRLAFAAALVASQGYPVEILHPEVVDKSFPEFWQLL
ncbi:MAG: hypothetical protein EOP06_15780, partial [Proteobacteria bacterium]